MLGKSPELLLQSLLAEPDMYEDGLDEVIQLLAYKKKTYADLRKEDQDKIDRATFDFARGARPKPKPREDRPAPELPMAARAALDDLDVELAYNEGGPPTPLHDIQDEPPSFWWKRH